jgi:hypothetical protein
MNQETIEGSLINSISSDNIKDIAIDSAEVSLDHFLGDGLLKDIPVFGILYKTYKVTVGIREAFFLNKLLKFLTQLKDIPSEKRIAFVHKIESNPNEKIKTGQKLLVIIEQLDDLDKATIIGNLFCATINEQIKYEEFLRLSSMVQKGFLPDILKLRGSLGSGTTDTHEQLYNVGLLSATITEDKTAKMSIFGDDNKPGPLIFSYETNNWAYLLRKYGLSTKK